MLMSSSVRTQGVGTETQCGQLADTVVEWESNASPRELGETGCSRSAGLIC